MIPIEGLFETHITVSDLQRRSPFTVMWLDSRWGFCNRNALRPFSGSAGAAGQC